VTTAPAIEIQRLSKAYSGMLAVDTVDLEVPAGEKLGLIGPNGAGKSTLFGLIAGEHQPSRGRVLVKGSDVTRWSVERRISFGIGRTFQVARVFPTLTAAENVRMSAVAKSERGGAWLLRFAARGEVAEAADEKLEAVGLRELSGKLASDLGHGDRKRLELAMALVQNPEILLLDEPTAGMSYADTVRTIELLAAICSDANLTIVCTAHDMALIFAISERVVLLARGRIAFSGTPREVEEHPITREIYLGVS
jgi:branched-chain amino acid transport system ATP-binding protein